MQQHPLDLEFVYWQIRNYKIIAGSNHGKAASKRTISTTTAKHSSTLPLWYGALAEIVNAATASPKKRKFRQLI